MVGSGPVCRSFNCEGSSKIRRRILARPPPIDLKVLGGSSRDHGHIRLRLSPWYVVPAHALCRQPGQARVQLVEAQVSTSWSTTSSAGLGIALHRPSCTLPTGRAGLGIALHRPSSTLPTGRAGFGIALHRPSSSPPTGGGVSASGPLLAQPLCMFPNGGHHMNNVFGTQR